MTIFSDLKVVMRRMRSARRRRAKLVFSFSEIQDILYKTTAENYAIRPPLPYSTKRGAYKGGPIPNLVHFIWIGSPIPQKYIDNIREFTNLNSTLSVILWVDHACPAIRRVDVRLLDAADLLNSDIYHRSKNVAVRADLLRLEKIYRYGGIYSDVDVKVVQPLDSTFQRSFLCFEPHTWRDTGNAMFGFAQNDDLMSACVRDLAKHIEWILSSRQDLLLPNGDNVSRLCGGLYIMATLFTFSNLAELQFINQDYVITDTGFGYSYHTNDATWCKSLCEVENLYS